MQIITTITVKTNWIDIYSKPKETRKTSPFVNS